MIKLLALITMLIDHIGLIFCPEVWILRFIGRLAMPLFGYCIARGFYYSKMHGTINKYLMNLWILTMVSEIPYCLMEKRIAIDIGFTWMLAVIVLQILESDMARVKRYIIAGAILLFAAVFYFFMHFDFGIYGVMTAVCMYYLMIKKNVPYSMFLASVILWAFYVLVLRQPFEQFFAVFAVILLVLIKPYDNKIKLPKKIYYWFYPLHMTLLLLLNYMFFK